MPRSYAVVFVSFALVSIGCGDSNGPGVIAPDLSNESVDMLPDLLPGPPDLYGLPPADHDPTLHPPMPTMTNVGQTTVTAPEVWTVIWNSGATTYGPKIDKFLTTMFASDYWKNGMKEWGVVGGVNKGLLVINAPPPATLQQTDFSQIINQNLGKNGWPTAGTNTIISFVLDPSTTIVNGGKAESCVLYDGYHYMTLMGVRYLVNAFCKDSSGTPDFDELTITISHEVAEAASDWDLRHNRVVDSVTGAPYLGGGENGDMCLVLDAKLTATTGEVYQVQRLFSNVIAKMNGSVDCCQDPNSPPLPYFGAGLWSGLTDQSLIEIARVSGRGQVAIKIEPFAYDPNQTIFGPVGFHVVGSQLPKGVTLTPDIARRPDPNNPGQILGMRAWGVPGSTTMVTVTVDNTFPAASVGSPIPFLIVAYDYNRTIFNNWWGTLIVTN
jgi:hypothetical protein